MSAKYPRIPHLPWSPGGTSDDKRLSIASYFLAKDIVITEKMDGSNLCMTRDYVYARSHAGSPTHRSFDQAKALHAAIHRDIDPGISIFGEWCYAVHSMEYSDLPGHFLVFGHRWDHERVPIEFAKGIFTKGPFWWSWDMTNRRAKQLKLPIVPMLWTGRVNSEEELQELTDGLGREPSVCGGEREGLVVRAERMFSEDEFQYCVAKWVREDHPKNPDEHWSIRPIKKQGLKDG
jgi:hypothetical protein